MERINSIEELEKFKNYKSRILKFKGSVLFNIPIILEAGWSIEAEGSIEAGGSIEADGSIEAGGFIKACRSIEAGGFIADAINKQLDGDGR